jgi:hypothetical protein
MSQSNAAILPPTIADFRSVAATFLKKDTEGDETLYLRENKKFFQAKGLSAKFKAAIISRSSAMQLVRGIRAMTVPLKDLY